jgi:DNA end-binding protein Ku
MSYQLSLPKENCMAHNSISAETTAGSAVTVASPPAGRPSWSGLLQFSLVTMPVKAYPAVSTTETVHFNQLHADCGQRLRYEKRCPVHGPVETAAIVKGYPYAPDRYVVVEPAELDKLRPARDRSLRLERFIDARQVDPALFAGRTLYLVPDGLAAHRPFRVLNEALRQRDKWAIGRVVLSGHRQVALLRPAGTILAIDLLHYPSQMRTAPAFGQAGGAASPEELQLATMLIDSASGPADWSQYRDDTAAELRALVEAKIAGQPLADSAEEPAAILSLLDALKQSVAVAGKAAPKQDVAAVTVRGQDVAKQSVNRCQNMDPSAPRKRSRKEPRRTA